MEVSKQCYRAAAIFLSSMFFTACQDSIDIETESMVANLSVTSYGAGVSYLNAGLDTDGLFTSITLSDDDRFFSEFSDERLVMEKTDSSTLPFPLNVLFDVMEDILPYVSEYASEQPGDTFSIILQRSNGEEYLSTASLPAVPVISEPANLKVFSTDQDITIKWQTVGTDLLTLDHVSFCFDIDSAGGDPYKLLMLTEQYPDATSEKTSLLVPDSGSYTLTADELMADVVPAPGMTHCKVRVELIHSVPGNVDSRFKAGSYFEASQIREVNFYIPL